MIIDSTKYNWYAIRTIPHKEKHVSKELEFRSFDWYLPYCKFYINKNDYKEKLLIRSYIFVKACNNDFEKLRFIPGSKGLLLYDNQPATVSEEEMEILQRICGESELEPEVNKYEPGAKVKILSGFLSGRTARICKCEKNKIGIELNQGNFIVWIKPNKILFEIIE